MLQNQVSARAMRRSFFLRAVGSKRLKEPSVPVTRTFPSGAKSIPQGLAEPEPAVVIGDLADSAVTWQVRVWANTPDWAPAKDALTVAIKKELDAAGLGIPFPQMDVHFDSPEITKKVAA